MIRKAWSGWSMLLVLLVAGPAAAGEIYGTVTVRSPAGPAAGAVVSINCGNEDGRADTATTNAQGQYTIRTTGPRTRCRVTVSHGGRSSSGVTIQLSGPATRANLELAPRDGQWSLVRR